MTRETERGAAPALREPNPSSRNSDGSTVATSRQLDPDEYLALVARIRDVVATAVPQGATVAVVSRGDAELIELDGRQGWHFPQASDGRYAGHHPANSEDAIAQLEMLHAQGAEYVLFPATALWWLEHYADLKQHLDRWYRRLVDDRDTCVIYSFREPAGGDGLPDQRAWIRYHELVQQVRELVESTLPSDAAVLVLNEGAPELLDLDGRETEGFPSGEGEPAELVAKLEKARSAGAQYLLVPASTTWWLDENPTLKRHLERRYHLAVRQEHVCLVYELTAPLDDQGRGWRRAFRRASR